MADIVNKLDQIYLMVTFWFAMWAGLKMAEAFKGVSRGK